jgi:mono/diheme cytochrome c family protein
MKHPILKFVLLAFGLGAVAVILIASGVGNNSAVSQNANIPLSPEQIAVLAPRGKYLTRAADCGACHTAEGRAPYAGGRPFVLPTGTIYATNITPDPDTGIGNWTRADFHRALRDGVKPGGAPLYPAMPYTSYRLLSEQDVDAIYAYFTTISKVSQPNPVNSFPFPLVRRAMYFWDLMNLPDASAPSPDRGQYLVDALGHCGECHTPRNITMAMIPGKYLQGAEIEGVEAPALTSQSLVRDGFTISSLADFLRFGQSPQGVANYSMAEVIQHSTQYLTADDATAMATYLLGPHSVSPAPPQTVANTTTLPGHVLYLQTCAACHGVSGEGLPHIAPPLNTNTSVSASTPTNLLTTILKGLPAADYPGGESFQAMPGFAAQLTDQQVADLVTYMRATWSPSGGAVTSDQVSAHRASAGRSLAGR